MDRTSLHKTLLVFSLTLALIFTFAFNSFAEVVGTFSRVEGRVDILKAGEASAVPVKRDDSVSMGDIVRTKSDGKAEITFKDDTTVRIAPETRMKIDEYVFNPDNSRKTGALGLFRGKVRAVVSKSKGIIPVAIGASTFNVNTPTAVAGVRGTDFFVFHDRGITGVIFKEGSGFVLNPSMPEQVVNVNAGQVTFVVSPEAPPLPPRPATSVELAVHTKDTTPAEKPKEEEKEEKPKEKEAPVKEAKAEEGVKEEKPAGEKPAAEPEVAEKPVEEKPAAEAKAEAGEAAPAGGEPAPDAEAAPFAPPAEKLVAAETATAPQPLETVMIGTPEIAAAPPAPVEVKSDIPVVNIPDIKTLIVADIIPAADIGWMITPAVMTSPIPIGGDLGLTGAGAVDTVSIPTAITTAVSWTTVDTSSVDTVNLLPITETHPNLLTDVTINLKFP